jgi:hypothetical protein
MRADGTRERALFRRRGVVANRPSWSPGGAQIAFGVTSEDEHGGFDAGSIVVIGRRGGRLRYVTDGRREPPRTPTPEPGPRTAAPTGRPTGSGSRSLGWFGSVRAATRTRSSPSTSTDRTPRPLSRNGLKLWASMVAGRQPRRRGRSGDPQGGRNAGSIAQIGVRASLAAAPPLDRAWW